MLIFSGIQGNTGNMGYILNHAVVLIIIRLQLFFSRISLSQKSLANDGINFLRSYRDTSLESGFHLVELMNIQSGCIQYIIKGLLCDTHSPYSVSKRRQGFRKSFQIQKINFLLT